MLELGSICLKDYQSALRTISRRIIAERENQMQESRSRLETIAERCPRIHFGITTESVTAKFI